MTTMTPAVGYMLIALAVSAPIIFATISALHWTAIYMKSRISRTRQEILKQVCVDAFFYAEDRTTETSTPETHHQLMFSYTQEELKSMGMDVKDFSIEKKIRAISRQLRRD